MTIGSIVNLWHSISRNHVILFNEIFSNLKLYPNRTQNKCITKTLTDIMDYYLINCKKVKLKSKVKNRNYNK